MRRERRFSGAKLQHLREDRNILQHDLADKLRRRGYGTTQATVSRWENGQEPRSYVMGALADELGVGVEDLYSDDEEEDPLPLSRDFYAAYGEMTARIVAHQAKERV